MAEPASSRFAPEAAAAVRAAIAAADGNEVFFVGRIRGDAGLVAEVEVRCRGNEEAVPAVLAAAGRGDVAIHNHPSGLLVPSAADLHVAGELGDRAVGFFIVDSTCERCYVVVEPFEAAPPVRLEPDEIAAALAPGGGLAGAHPEYEDRPEQRAMAAAVAAALNDDRLLAVEAGTGTGKSLAYLLPAAAWAKASGERVVVSTHTISLQEQLLHKDLPLLARHLPVEAALVKGRGNYLCLRKLAQAGEAGETELFDEQGTALAELAAWAARTTDGSLADLPAPPPDDLWEQVRVESDDCGRVRCAHYARCFYFQARRRAARAAILIVNHHLLMADLAVRAETDAYGASLVLPPYGRVILDEAHHLEAAATAHFGERASMAGLRRLCGRLRHARRPGRGLLGLVAARLEQAAAPSGPEEQAAARALAARLREDIDGARRETLARVEELFEEIGRIAERSGGDGGRMGARARGGDESVESDMETERGSPAPRSGVGGPARPGSRAPGSFALRLRLAPGFEESSVWLDELYPALAELARECAGLGAIVLRAAEQAAAFVADDGTPLASALIDLTAAGRRIAALGEVVTRFLEPDEERCRWIESIPPSSGRGRQVSLESAPIDAGPALHRALHDRFGTVVAASATLTVAGSFDHFLDRSGFALAPAQRRAALRLDSPFDFARQALLGVPTDLFPPDHPRAEERLARFLVEAATVTGGRMLALFTSHASLRRVHALAADALASRGITARRQGDEPRARLLGQLAAGGRTVLLATDSFWEGVDVPGEALSCVLVARLPFGVPTEPLVAARLEALSRRGRDPFLEHSVPEAVLRLRQGFGRLIRTRRDRGAVLLCDPRALDRRYGALFLDSLPPARRVVGPGTEVLEALRERVA